MTIIVINLNNIRIYFFIHTFISFLKTKVKNRHKICNIYSLVAILYQYQNKFLFCIKFIRKWYTEKNMINCKLYINFIGVWISTSKRRYFWIFVHIRLILKHFEWFRNWGLLKFGLVREIYKPKLPNMLKRSQENSQLVRAYFVKI